MSDRNWRLALAIACLASVIVTAAAQGSPARTTGSAAAKVYIVQLAGEPAVSYEGGVAGIPATKPAKGEKIDPQDANVQRYVAHLNARHDAVLARVGGANKLYDYNYVLNGFAAQLSDAQAAALEKLPEVTSIEEAEEYYPDTVTTPDFLGLTGPTGLWAQLGGPQSGSNASNATGAGEGIVVGIIDTGIWPEHPSVSDRINGKVMYKPLPGNRWKGKCASAETVTDGSWDANLCNNKLVGARFFLETREAVLGPVTAPDFRSPRDLNGHGTHVGTTAAGNHGITPTGSLTGFDKISGIAPRARLAAYKVCWPSCFSPDSAAAFDAAVADGVDVINFSISGSTSALTGFVPDATRRAAEAGVFVSMSAGNSGPGDSTVAHVMPWVTTVAAGTHPRPANGVVTLGNGQVYNGVSLISSTVGPAPLIRAQDAGLPTANPNLLRQCFSTQEPTTGGQAQLDPAKVAGKIVVCERGGAAPLNARVDKSAAVKEAGGVGAIIINVTPNSLNGDVHTLPTVHLQNDALTPVQAYAQTEGATATLSQGSTAPNAAPFVAAFSSRGPQAGAQQNLLKPDVIAPGVDILAGYSPASFELFNIISGTSMSSPHVAGMAALLKHRHPGWSPMTIKSALMTTGYSILGSFTDNNAASSEARRTFAEGAGHTRPTLAANPGLVFEHGPADWSRYICGAGQAACTNPLHPTDLNGASIAIGAMPGARTVERTVTNVSGSAQAYTAAFSGLPGINATIDHGMFTIAAGASQTLSMTFTNQSAQLNKWQTGHLTLTPTAGGNAVRIPIVIRPVAIAAPAAVSLGSDNNASWSIRSGVSGTINLSKTGLQAADTDQATIADDPSNTFVVGGPGTWSKSISVPNNSLVRFDLFDEDTDGNDDLDLYLYRGTTLVSSSGSPSSREFVTHRNTAGAATYTVYVHAWQTDGPDAEFTLFGWTLTADGQGTVSPSSVVTTPGQDHAVTLTGSGLTPGTRYLGEVAYTQGTIVLARTLVSGKAQ
ncbi:MAG TPA: S8 family serine peptidase [Gaiellaceae bacterium]|nr:S8 family serine peptidase [Gaiellaceae bacterium]